MKFSFVLFLLSQVTFCDASFDKIREETEAAILGKAAAATLKKDIALVRDALAEASPGSDGRRIEASILFPVNRVTTGANKNGDRKLKKKKPKFSKTQNSQCEANLAAAQEQILELSEPPKPALLGIQTARYCRIERAAKKGQYKLISNTVSEDTYIFSDRPDTIEYTVPTDEFIRDFDTIFEDVPPNVGLTFVTDGEPVGPFVVIFEDAKIEGNEVTYDIDQSENQQGVLSMESIFGTNDYVDFDDCSYFIDNWATDWITCPACKGALPTLLSTGGGLACNTACAAVLGTACVAVFGVCAAACPFLCSALFGGIGVVTSDSFESICESSVLC